ncbi:MAG: hypothetical protein F4Z60_04320 [Chloroflexi bacterium]|nr:hypothetical protein [Chloroflexota bacterium]
MACMELRRRGRPRHPDVLTPAEWRVLEQLREGGTNAEIGTRLGITADGVKLLFSNMLSKLGVRDRHELAAWRPDARRGRLRALFGIPAAVWSVTRPLARVGAGTAAVAGTVLAAALVAAVVAMALAGAGDTREPSAGAPQTATIHLRIWQHVDEPEDTWISARHDGGHGSEIGPIPFPVGGQDGAHQARRYRVLRFADAEVRITRLVSDHGRVGVHACGAACREASACLPWGGTVYLDDGIGMGSYRYGDVTLTFPLINEQLEADAAHLLELRDTLAGRGSLNWSAESDISTWTGVTVEGSPPSVTKLELANYGLNGELTGLLGELTALTTLRLDGNDLTGGIPSKLTQLPRLTHLHLGGNALSGCVPPSLRDVPSTDVNSLGLPVCGPPIDISYDAPPLAEGTYLFRLNERASPLIFDVPARVDLRLGELVFWDGRQSGGVFIVLRGAGGSDLRLDVRPCERRGQRPRRTEQSPDAAGEDLGLPADVRWFGEQPTPTSILDRIEESRWFGDAGWPPPPELTVLRVGASNVPVLWWADEPALATSWQYRQRAGSDPATGPWGAWTVIPHSGVTTRSYRVDGLRPGEAYEFQVRRHGGEDATPSNSASGAMRPLPRDGIPTIGDRETVIGDGVNEWRVLDSDYVVTLPVGVRFVVTEHDRNGAIIWEVGATRYVHLDLTTGRTLSWTRDSFAEGIVASIREAPAVD